MHKTNPAKILVVDDEEEICDFLKSLLSMEGYDVKCVMSGERAISETEQSAFDLAIIDLKLSTRITGIDVIRHIRTEMPKTQVVVMTGYVDAGLKHDAEALGITSFIEKPGAVSPDVIIPLVRESLKPK